MCKTDLRLQNRRHNASEQCRAEDCNRGPYFAKRECQQNKQRDQVQRRNPKELIQLVEFAPSVDVVDEGAFPQAEKREYHGRNEEAKAL